MLGNNVITNNSDNPEDRYEIIGIDNGYKMRFMGAWALPALKGAITGI
jgi:hypothetical protein